MDVLLDSCAWIEFFEGSEKGKKVRKYIEGDFHIVQSTINIAEIYRHFLATSPGNAKEAINTVSHRSDVLPLYFDQAILAAKLKDEHKMALGVALVLATALIHKATLVTFDSDFKDKEHCLVL